MWSIPKMDYIFQIRHKKNPQSVLAVGFDNTILLSGDYNPHINLVQQQIIFNLYFFIDFKLLRM